MSVQTVPERVRHNRPKPYIPGTFIGSLRDAESRWNNDQTRLNLTVWFRDVTVVEAEQSPGNRPFRQRFALVAPDKDDKLVALVDVGNWDDENIPIPIIQSAGLASQLAEALGAAEIDEQGNALVDFDAFFEQLENGMYTDAAVMFEVGNRTFTRRDKTIGVDDSAVSFASPEAEEEEEAPVEVAETTAEAPKEG